MLNNFNDTPYLDVIEVYSLVTSNCSRGGGVLIAIENSHQPTYLTTSHSNVEKPFTRISPDHGLSAIISVVYIPPVGRYNSL